jgi:excisionase family DNA binding protein
MAQKWVTMSQACLILGVSRRTLTRRISEGTIESKKLEGRLVPDMSQEGTNEGQIGTSDNVVVEPAFRKNK